MHTVSIFFWTIRYRLYNSTANVFIIYSAYLVRKEASISKQFEVERQDEGSDEDETGKEKHVGDVMRRLYVAAVRHRSVTLRPVHLLKRSLLLFRL